MKMRGWLGADCSVFFRLVRPYCAVLHPPTFHHRLYLGVVSPFLLDAIYALASRFSNHPLISSSLGRPFAHRTRGILASSPPPQVSWEETELVQALLLLALYHAPTGQGDAYLEAAFSLLHPTSSGMLRAITDDTNIETLTLNESRNRTFWMMCLHDMTSSTAQRAPRNWTQAEVKYVPLSSDESSWIRYGGGAQAAGRDGLSEENAIGELGQTTRIVRALITRAETRTEEQLTPRR